MEGMPGGDFAQRARVKITRKHLRLSTSIVLSTAQAPEGSYSLHCPFDVAYMTEYWTTSTFLLKVIHGIYAPSTAASSEHWSFYSSWLCALLRSCAAQQGPACRLWLARHNSKKSWSEELKAFSFYQLIFVHKLCHRKVDCIGFGGHWDRWRAKGVIPMALWGLLAVTAACPFPRSRRGSKWGWARTVSAVTQAMIPSRATRPLAQHDHQMGLGRKVCVSGDSIAQWGVPHKVCHAPWQAAVWIRSFLMLIRASSRMLVEMVGFSFWYLLAQFLLLFTSCFFWNHLSNGNVCLVLFQGEITWMMVERHCLGLAAKCELKTSVLTFLNLTVQFGGSEAKEWHFPRRCKASGWNDIETIERFPSFPKFWKSLFDLLPATEAVPPGQGPCVCHVLSKQGLSLWAEVSQHVLQHAAVGEIFGLSISPLPVARSAGVEYKHEGFRGPRRDWVEFLALNKH